MRISGEQTLSSPRERVWDLFNDPARLATLVPGVQRFNVLGNDEFEGTISVAVAAVKGVFNGRVKIQERVNLERLKASFEGKGTQGFLRGSGTLELASNEQGGTIVRYSADVEVGGPIVQVGQRMLESVAKKMAGDFFSKAENELKK